MRCTTITTTNAFYALNIGAFNESFATLQLYASTIYQFCLENSKWNQYFVCLLFFRFFEREYGCRETLCYILCFLFGSFAPHQQIPCAVGLSIPHHTTPHHSTPHHFISRSIYWDFGLVSIFSLFVCSSVDSDTNNRSLFKCFQLQWWTTNFPP